MPERIGAQRILYRDTKLIGPGTFLLRHLSSGPGTFLRFRVFWHSLSSLDAKIAGIILP